MRVMEGREGEGVFGLCWFVLCVIVVGAGRGGTVLLLGRGDI